MNNKNKIIITYGLWLADMVAITLSFFAATYIRFGNFIDMKDKQSHFMVCLVLVLAGTLYSFFIAWNTDFMKRRHFKELYVIIRMNVVVVLVALMAMFFFKWADSFSRWVILYFFVIDIVVMYLFHILFKKSMKAYYSTESSKIKVLVITEEPLREKVTERLENDLDLSYQIIDVIYTGAINEGFYDEATTLAVDEVFIYTPSWSQSSVNKLIHFFYDMGVKCDYCMELTDISSKRSYVGSFAEFSVISYIQAQGSYKKLMVKRAMDIVGGLIGSIFTIIFTPFIALAIKINSKGPVFFSQTRIGRNGRRFKIYKFRSMYIDAEERKKELEDQNEVDGLMFKIKDDPRITKVGRFIRKTSIDELPQFFNIVKGDMSLVGTRPPTEDEFEKYDQHYRRRLSMTPGLTGLWQVSGRSDVDNFDDVVKYDLEYIDNWSLSLDIKILFKTIGVVFTGRGSK